MKVEPCFLELKKHGKTYRDAIMENEVHKCHFKDQYDKSIHPRLFLEGYLVLHYDQSNETLGEGKFVTLWHDTYVVKFILSKGSYELEDYEGNNLKDPCNGLFLKRYYA